MTTTKKTKELQKVDVKLDFTNETVDLIKRTIAKDATNDELQLFLYQSKRTGLDPLARQIYFVKRAGKVVIQTSIDGFRVVAERNGDYAGQDEPEFVENNQLAGQPPLIAKVRVYKFRGEQRYLAATGVAYWSEYVPQPGQDFMWKKMPHTMLAKVAEALALRKAFPQDLSGLYTDEEMEQANGNGNGTTQTTTPSNPTANYPQPKASDAQVKMIFSLTNQLGYESEKAKELVKAHYKLESFTDLTKAQATNLIDQLMKKVEAKKAQPTATEPVEGEVVAGEEQEEIDLDEVDKGIAEMKAEEAKADDDPDWIKNGDKPEGQAS